MLVDYCNIFMHIGLLTFVRTCMQWRRKGGLEGLEGLEPPNFLEREAEALQKYMSVMSSTSYEQYCFKWYS